MNNKKSVRFSKLRGGAGMPGAIDMGNAPVNAPGAATNSPAAPANAPGAGNTGDQAPGKYYPQGGTGPSLMGTSCTRAGRELEPGRCGPAGKPLPIALVRGNAPAVGGTGTGSGRPVGQ